MIEFTFSVKNLDKLFLWIAVKAVYNETTLNTVYNETTLKKSQYST